jgi:hypothetical protein
MASESFNTREYGVNIEDEEYENLMSEVMKMKPRKRKNFKGFLTDKWGVKTRLIYRKNDLWNYCLHTKKFCVVQTFSTTRNDAWKDSKIKKLYPNCDGFIDAVAKHHTDKEFMKLFESVVEEEMRRGQMTEIGAMLYFGFRDETIENAIQQHKVDTHTGNADGRARKVKVTKNMVMNTTR